MYPVFVNVLKTQHLRVATFFKYSKMNRAEEQACLTTYEFFKLLNAYPNLKR
jgi:hypothetical protein